MQRIVVLFLTIFGCYAIESNFYREESCASSRGYCVLPKECPHSVEQSHLNLCNNQKSSGAVCCVDFSDLNCYQLHHDCKNDCPTKLNLGQKGCSPGQKCCALI